MTKRPNHAERTWVAPNVVAQRLGVTVKTVGRMADRGQIPFLRLPSGHRRFALADVEALAASTEKASA